MAKPLAVDEKRASERREKHLESLPAALRDEAKKRLGELASDADFVEKRRYMDWFFRVGQNWTEEHVEDERARTQVATFNFVFAVYRMPWISKEWNRTKVDSKICEMNGWTVPWDVLVIIRKDQEPEEAYTMWRSWRKGVAAASQSQETQDELAFKVPFEDGKKFLEWLEFSELWRCEHSSDRSASLAGSTFEQSTQAVDGATSSAVGDSEDAKEPEGCEAADRGSRG